MKFLKTLIIHVLFAAGVCLAVWVSSFYRYPQHITPLITLGSGIILGTLVRYGGKIIPALGVGLFCAHYFLVGYIFFTSLWVSSTMLITGWIALCNMRRYVSADLIDRPVHNYLHFYVAAMLISPVINALLDLPLIWLLGYQELVPDIRLLIFSYSFGGALGSLVFAPAIILFGRNYHLKYAYANYIDKRQEKILWCVAAVCLITLTFFLGKRYFFAGLLDAELLLYPMMIWSALRLGVVFTNIAVAFVAYTVFTFHFFGLAGTSSEMSIPEVLGMLLLIVTLAILGQLVAATALERRKKEALLEKVANQAAVTGLPNTRSLYLRLKQLTYNELENGNKHWLG
ncbi:MAG: hypothetical protein KAI17_27450, partial [Thiotrichaceae bacterium]|nr:hypothetical protein [Thiotrichaceae bacterium]